MKFYRAADGLSVTDGYGSMGGGMPHLGMSVVDVIKFFLRKSRFSQN